MEIDKHPNEKIITIQTLAGKDEIITRLMEYMYFEEIGRDITGGRMSSEMIHLTFKGSQWNINYSLYAEVFDDAPGGNWFYSIYCPLGVKGWQNFLKRHKKEKEKQVSIKIKELKE